MVAGRDLGYATGLPDAVAARGDTGFSLLTGTDSLLVPYLQAGARGTSCSNANVLPDLVLAVYQAATSGKLAEARRASRSTKSRLPG